MATSASVAPDFDVRSHFNTLRVKPEYRITLRLGEFEDLFQNDAGTIKGRMERLQALGLFYFPLSHGKAEARYEKAWIWFKQRILAGKGNPPKTDTEADAILKTAVKCRIVGGAVPADWSAAASELPPDAADPAKPEEANFAKIRVPGGYASNYSDAGGIDINLDPNCPAGFIKNTLFEHEAQFYRDNFVLGLIPLVAKVERRPPGGGDWAPAEKVDVHFQLVPTFEPPAYDSGRPAIEQFNRPPVSDSDQGRPDSGSGIGPKKRYDAAESVKFEATDPQGRNCYETYGGKRGKGMKDVIFSVKEMPGFNTPRDTRKMSHNDYPVAVEAPVVGDAHKHAVKAATNADGEAGVIFMPSQMGGDRYRLRAYLPSTGDGASAGSVAATTGTFIVWRNIRMSRIVRQEVASPDTRLLIQAQPAPYNQATARDYLAAVGAHDGTSAVGLATVNIGLSDGKAGGYSYDPLPRQFARAFCELEFDPDAVEPIGEDEWLEACRLAVGDMSINLKKEAATFDAIQQLDVEALFARDISFASPETTVCGLPMRSPEAYNALVKPKQKLTIDSSTGLMDTREYGQIEKLVTVYGLNGFLRSLSWNGALPGLTLVYQGMGYTWQILFDDRYTGLRRNFRGVFLWGGAWNYENASYDCASNACHELGHSLFMPHAPNAHVTPEEAKEHDDIADCVCVMSYEDCAGRYCGKTLLTLRGWNIKGKP